jgi:hypothetical protein
MNYYSGSIQNFQSFFPMVIKYEDTGHIVTVRRPGEIITGRSFRIIENNNKTSDIFDKENWKG